MTSGFDSRAAFLTWLVEREAQRERSWQEIRRMKRQGIPLDDPEVDAIAKATQGTSLADLDEYGPPTGWVWTRSDRPCS